MTARASALIKVGYEMVMLTYHSKSRGKADQNENISEDGDRDKRIKEV